MTSLPFYFKRLISQSCVICLFHARESCRGSPFSYRSDEQKCLLWTDLKTMETESLLLLIPAR